MADAPHYGRIFGLWRGQCGKAWQAYIHHAFVAGLGDGSLPRAAFLHYLRQDYLFLIHFARAWALAAVKAGTLSEMKAAAAMVNALVHQEMQLHVETCARAGISEAELLATRERPENLAYTRYVLEAGYSGDFLDLMAALAPCVLGYGEIGAWLRRAAGSPVYQDWIETYGGQDYQAECRDVGLLIDQAAESRLGSQMDSHPRWAELCGKFRTATELEIGFWDMGLSPHPTSHQ